jgi:hypothetical protein
MTRSNQKPRPGELYRDPHGHTFEVVDMALSLDSNRPAVVYRVKGGTGLFTLSVDKRQEAIEAGALTFPSLAMRNAQKRPRRSRFYPTGSRAKAWPPQATCSASSAKISR